jgi:hypothetical protein
MTMGLRRMQAAPSAAISYLSVVWGALAGFFVFHEVLTVMEGVGAAIICLGTMAVVVSEGWQQRRRDAAKAAVAQNTESHGSDDEEAQLLALELSDSKGWSAPAESEGGALASGLRR